MKHYVLMAYSKLLDEYIPLIAFNERENALSVQDLLYRDGGYLHYELTVKEKI